MLADGLRVSGILFPSEVKYLLTGIRRVDEGGRRSGLHWADAQELETAATFGECGHLVPCTGGEMVWVVVGGLGSCPSSLPSL